jgi:hypothetical protein
MSRWTGSKNLKTSLPVRSSHYGGTITSEVAGTGPEAEETLIWQEPEISLSPSKAPSDAVVYGRNRLQPPVLRVDRTGPDP